MIHCQIQVWGLVCVCVCQNFRFFILDCDKQLNPLHSYPDLCHHTTADLHISSVHLHHKILKASIAFSFSCVWSSLAHGLRAIVLGLNHPPWGEVSLLASTLQSCVNVWGDISVSLRKQLISWTINKIPQLFDQVSSWIIFPLHMSKQFSEVFLIFWP